MSSDEAETNMESSSTVRPNSTPKLSLFSLPKKQVEHAPGMLTPPLQAAAAVPFQWEEAPGRPKPPGHGYPKPNSARCLDLPPRMLIFDSAAKLASTPSPTTVLDGPDVGVGGRSLSSTWSSFRAGEGKSKRFEVKEKVGFGSSRWGILKGRSKGGRVCEEEEEEESLGDILSSVLGDDGGCGGGGGETKVKITRVKRRGSFFSPSHSKSKSHLWVRTLNYFHFWL